MVNTLLVASAGRSGSTLLTMLLGAHPAALALGEITLLPRNLAENSPCSCGARVCECGFWRETVDLLGRRLQLDLRSDPFSLQLGFMCNPKKKYLGPMTAAYERQWKLRHGAIYLLEQLRMPQLSWMEPAFHAGVSNTCALFQAARETSGSSHVVDSSKTYLKSLALYRREPESTRILLLTRDGRASFYSRVRDGYGRDDSVAAWRNYYQRFLPLLERNVDPEHVCRVKYEDLAADPARELQRICRKVQLDYDPAMLDVHGRTQHVTDGNDMRLKSDRTIRPDTAWQSALSREDRDFFESHAGELNRSLGYH